MRLMPPGSCEKIINGRLMDALLELSSTPKRSDRMIKSARAYIIHTYANEWTLKHALKQTRSRVLSQDARGRRMPLCPDFFLVLLLFFFLVLLFRLLLFLAVVLPRAVGYYARILNAEYYESLSRNLQTLPLCATSPPLPSLPRLYFRR